MRSVRAVVWLYTRALKLLPRAGYGDYAQEMVQDFRNLAERAAAGGGVLAVAAVVAVALRGLADVMWRALLERQGGSMGNQVSERARISAGERVSMMGHELRLAARGLLKRPGFTLITVLTLALGIGANVAIFAVVNAILIRPLPYPESERIVWIRHHAPGIELPELENSVATLKLYREHARSFSALGAFSSGQRNLTGGAEPARINSLEVTPSFFDVLRVQPLLGRRLLESDAVRGAQAVALLSHRGWRTHFGESRSVVGKVIQLDGIPTEVVGVLPRHFTHPNPDVEIVVPLVLDEADGFRTFGIGGIARLAPGISMAAAQAEISRLQSRIPEMYPSVSAGFLESAGWSASLRTLRNALVGSAEVALWVVLGTVGFLLLVACASVANLFLVRAEGRQREVGVRLALGATRARVASTFLSESLLLGLAGGAWGLLLALAGVRTLVASGPAQLPRLHEVNIDLRVLGFALVVSLVAGAVFGLLPLPQQLRRPMHGLVRAGRGNFGSRERQRVRKALIISQIALAVVLVTGSGLMLRSFQRLRAVQPGIRAEGVLTLGVSLGGEHSRAQAAASYARILEEIRKQPGVLSAGATNALPLRPEGMNGSSFTIESKPRSGDDLPTIVMYSAVSEDYLPAIGATLLQGRALDRDDREQKRAVIMVDQSMASRFLNNRAIGERIRFGSDSTWYEVVGIVGNVRMFGLREDVRPTAYLPLTATLPPININLLNFVVRTAGDPLASVASIRAAVQRVEPAVPITTALTMTQVMAESLAETSFTTTILLLSALVALLLGAIGLYGVINYVVTQRTQEIGVRIALGAVPVQVRTMVLRQGLVLGVLGVALGLAAAIGTTRVMESLLFEVNSRDPLIFTVVSAIMLMVSALAAYVPARRASSVSPLQALRSE